MHSFILFQNTFHHVDMVLAPWMLILHSDDTRYSCGENICDELVWGEEKFGSIISSVWFVQGQFWKVAWDRKLQAKPQICCKAGQSFVK